ncbi:MAG: hypothetical protein ACI9RO_002556 [Alteromonas macleodii]|jgi:hypothetical protein
MSYAPDWVLNVVCAKIVERFVMDSLPIEAFANRMSQELILRYSDCKPKKLSAISENMLYFLAEIDEDNPLNHCHNFAYQSVAFDKAGRHRRLKGFFFDPLAPVKNHNSGKSIVTNFRAFVFRSRSNNSLSAFSEWNLRDHKELTYLSDILDINVSVEDAD